MVNIQIFPIMVLIPNRVSEKVELSVTVRFFVTTSRVGGFYICYVMICSWLLRYHQARYSSSCPSWWCQAHLWAYLRRDSWCIEDFPWKRQWYVWLFIDLFANNLVGYSRLGYIHWTCKAENCHISRRCIRSQAIWPYTVRFRRVILCYTCSQCIGVPYCNLSYFSVFYWSQFDRMPVFTTDKFDALFHNGGLSCPIIISI